MPTPRPRPHLRPLRRALLVLAVVAVFAGACSDDGDVSTDDDPADTTGTTDSTDSTGSTGPADEAASVPERLVGFESGVYADQANWLCVPDAPNDRCATEDLDVTVVAADGSTEVREVPPAPDPSFDCFYVYPTINFGTETPADEAMGADTAAEEGIVRTQAARFSSVCDVYAPVYRQLTLGGFTAENRAELAARAADDVIDAFRHYMGQWNEGRPVLLIGHSQGAGMLTELLATEFAGDDELTSRLVSAMLIGGGTQIDPETGQAGRLDGLVPCTSPDQTGCLIGFNSVAADTAPADLERWGGAADGKQRLCTNPGDLSTAGPAPLRSVLGANGVTVDGVPVEVTTQWVELDGYLTAQCVTEGTTTTLVITPTDAPDDRRDIGDQLDSVAGWGLHLTEVGLTQIDLVDLAARQAEALG